MPNRGTKETTKRKQNSGGPSQVPFKPKRMNAVQRAQGNLLRDPEGTINPIPYTMMTFTPEQEAWVLHIMRSLNSAVESHSVMRSLYRHMDAEYRKAKRELLELRAMKPMHTDEQLRTRYGELLIENDRLKEQLKELECYKSLSELFQEP